MLSFRGKKRSRVEKLIQAYNHKGPGAKWEKLRFRSNIEVSVLMSTLKGRERWENVENGDHAGARNVPNQASPFSTAP